MLANYSLELEGLTVPLSKPCVYWIPQLSNSDVFEVVHMCTLDVTKRYYNASQASCAECTYDASSEEVSNGRIETAEVPGHQEVLSDGLRWEINIFILLKECFL